uniref:Craniofacial development protein 1 n=2 Tax=Schistocephalus solidus TaxID=70667 RepID=A0A0V0JA94_SCHSO
MGDSDHSLDTSDEEYVPPVDVEDSSDDKAESSEDEEDLLPAVVKKSAPEKVLDRDAVWNEFLQETETATQRLPRETPATTKPLQTPSVCTNASGVSAAPSYLSTSSATKTSISASASSYVTSSTPSKTSAAPSLAASPTPLNGIAPKRALASNDRLSDALKRLKSTALLPGAAPKLSTLEKSKRDWESFTQEEDIADELKLYNKGKYGYVARKAFESRASERQYAIVRELRLKGSQKR